jgi:CubicO group peptidase (beta-lactamase class C family)
MRRDTMFRLASLTKLVTSVAALRLCELGKLDLDLPITNWLPNFRPALADGSRPTITPRHLLSHVAGLSYGFEMPPGNCYEVAGISDGLDCCGFDLEENLRRLSSVPLQFRPGAAWQYSIATDVLGAVMSRAAGADLPAIVARHVTEPLGLPGIRFDVPLHPPVATPCRDGQDDGVPQAIGADHWLDVNGGRARVSRDRVGARGHWPSAGAGLIGNADDYLRLLECLRSGGRATPRCSERPAAASQCYRRNYNALASSRLGIRPRYGGAGGSDIGRLSATSRYVGLV